MPGVWGEGGKEALLFQGPNIKSVTDPQVQLGDPRTEGTKQAECSRLEQLSVRMSTGSAFLGKKGASVQSTDGPSPTIP